MMLVDSSVWIDYFDRGDAELAAALYADMVSMHPMVLGELALVNLVDRTETLMRLSRLPKAAATTNADVVTMIEARAVHGRGIGFVDAHLIASCLISGATLWTHDRRLHDVAVELGAA
jgi:predicted nucleic acid-binding protein